MNVSRLIGLMAIALLVGEDALAQNPPGGAQPGRGGGGGRGRAVRAMTLTSAAFADGGMIPLKYSQYGAELSPPLAWTGAPDSTRSFVLIVHDLDAVSGANATEGLIHWMAWNIPGNATSLPEAVPHGPQASDGTRQISVSGPYYRGPAAPPSGPAHHYVFELYALDAVIDVPPTGASPQATRAAVVAAMAGHVRGKGVLVGRFRKAHETQQAFWSTLQSMCGKAYRGTLTEGNASDSTMRRETLVMHVRECGPGEIRIPFHVGANRSRTWVITPTDDGLRLKHDHRHSDGTADSVTQYGGDTRGAGTETRQEFHADAWTASLIPAARSNVWTIEVIPGRLFAYALRREGTDRRFRVEFDLTRPVPLPPAPWGSGR